MNFADNRNFLYTELYTLTNSKLYKVYDNGTTWLQESSNTFHNIMVTVHCLPGILS